MSTSIFEYIQCTQTVVANYFTTLYLQEQTIAIADQVSNALHTVSVFHIAIWKLLSRPQL